MGPFPHNTTSPAISKQNPAGTDGFEAVEFAHPEPEKLAALFEQMGFSPVAKHKTYDATLYRQGDVNYILNAESKGFSSQFAKLHGPCACSMVWRVVDAKACFKRAISLGATAIDDPQTIFGKAPAIEGIGGSRIYFIDSYGAKGSFYDQDWHWLGKRDPKPFGVGLYYLDHLTHNVKRGNMNVWYEFYNKLFNFKEIRFFDIEGKHTGLFSRALTSPCGKIRIPINESADEKSQIEEYLKAYNGEGIQHIACGTDNIYQSVKALRDKALKFMPAPPKAYYQKVDARVPNHGEPLDQLEQYGILIDGEGRIEKSGEGAVTKILLQIFSKTVIGPIFFEFIERKGDEGFGEGNFKALFESIEEDQIRRGVLKKAG